MGLFLQKPKQRVNNKREQLNAQGTVKQRENKKRSQSEFELLVFLQVEKKTNLGLVLEKIYINP